MPVLWWSEGRYAQCCVKERFQSCEFHITIRSRSVSTKALCFRVKNFPTEPQNYLKNSYTLK